MYIDRHNGTCTDSVRDRGLHESVSGRTTSVAVIGSWNWRRWLVRACKRIHLGSVVQVVAIELSDDGERGWVLLRLRRATRSDTKKRAEKRLAMVLAGRGQVCGRNCCWLSNNLVHASASSTTMATGTTLSCRCRGIVMDAELGEESLSSAVADTVTYT